MKLEMTKDLKMNEIPLKAKKPLRKDARPLSEVIIEGLIKAGGMSGIIFIVAILVFILKESSGFLLSHFDAAEFFTSGNWAPASVEKVQYGTLALLAGTMSVTIVSMVIAVPVGLACAFYISEFCPPKMRETYKILIEFLAAIPSVVWGFIAIVIINPMMINVFNVPSGLNILNASLILALMSLPLIVSIGEDALRAVPESYREAAEALGATQWEIATRVLLPAAKNGLMAAALLGVGRALGETMAVLMATGHSIRFPTSVFDPVRTLTATIAAELGESPKGGEHYQALFAIGLYLFVLSFSVNFIADRLVRGKRK
ncbi:MAG: phosphate ABC transporter permease subunit PstC [Bacteriovoracaceae bacterium]|nr:phosphate ABC transporter permease subunit PstC [Bacteriovoracaceae bacterium]